MSYTLSRPSSFQRSGLLMMVVGLHVGLFLLILAVKTVVPQLIEMPLVVDLLPAPPPEIMPLAKPLPISKPEPVKTIQTPRPQPAPRQAPAPTPAPLIETSSHSEPAPNAVVAPPPQSVPLSVPVLAPEPVSQARFDADYLRNPAPSYPPLSRRMGEEGKVVLRVLVSQEGAAESVEVKATSGSTRLDEAAVNTVKRWKFIPAKRGDSAIQSWVLVPIIFKLEQ